MFLLASVLLSTMGCQTPADENQHPAGPFPKGEPAPAAYFTGKAWVQALVPDDSVFHLTSGSVTFEAGARSHWHVHPSGQILLVTAGTGYHQIKGQPRETIHTGDVVKCPPNVLHWHGASPDSPMTHIYILPNTGKGIVEWKEPVTDEEYQRSK
jgi:quercetin dioxygenase-like cupin family protein